MPETKSENPAEAFKRLTNQVLSVPRAEIQKREKEYKEQRKSQKRHR